MVRQALKFGPALESDIPAIHNLLRDVFGVPGEWRMFQPEILG
jgi:hypothetical protein